MFELNTRKLKPADIANSEFLDEDNNTEIALVAPLYWQEHCVECALPDCYKVCPLYSPRYDGNCKRFSYGIFADYRIKGMQNFGADIHFKKWAKLEAYWPSNPAMISKRRNFIESKIIFYLNVFYYKFFRSFKPLLKFFNKFLERFFRTRINSLFSRPVDGFYIKFYYPDSKPRKIQIEIKSTSLLLYRNIIDIEEGWNEKLIPYSQLPQNFSELTRISIHPIDSEPIRLVFSFLDLVKFKEQSYIEGLDKKNHDNVIKIKCICWDLDNTLWDGVIGDDGPENITINQEAVNLIKALDVRGILQSICSKNDFSIAWKKLVDEKLDHFFLFPEIHWNAKSNSINRIAKNLNIGIDSIGFIDDSIRELEEVSLNLPTVKVYNSNEIPFLLNKSEFDVPITSLSSSRREMYITESKRSSEFNQQINDVNEFLLSCKMELKISHPREENEINRCLELLQRTNQFNLTGNKYSLQNLQDLLSHASYKTFFGSLSDVYGDMGIVIFAAINTSNENVLLEEFVMSCRVAQKNVDLALIQWIYQKFERNDESAFQIKYKNTGKNKPMLEILKKLSISESIENKEFNIINIDGEVFSKNFMDFVKINQI